MPHAASEVHAVLTLHGGDGPNVLVQAIAALRKYAIGADGAMEFDVTHLWVRSFGPIGVVMLRFQTTEFAIRHLQRYCPHLRAQAQNPDRLIMTVHRADRPWSLDDTLRTQVFHASVRPTNEADGLSSESPQIWQHYATMANNLAADPAIDIAVYEMYRTRERLLNPQDDPAVGTQFASLPNEQTREVHCARLFDLGRRGDSYLEEAIQRARKYSGLGEPCCPIQNDLDEVWNCRIESTSQKVSDINRRLPFIEQRLENGAKYGYVFVHGLDAPGLFAKLVDFIQYHPGFTGKHARRSILRACCRGLGREGVIMLATILENAQRDAETLTLALRDLLEKFYLREGLVTEGESSSRREVPWAGFWRAEVVASEEPPAIKGFTPEKFVVVRPKVMLADDRPGILTDLVDRIEQSNKALNLDKAESISIFYANGRVERVRSRPGAGRNWMLGLGLIVPRGSRHSDQFCRWLLDWNADPNSKSAKR